MSILTDLIDDYNPEIPNFRPTEIYNENWLLKVFLHQAAKADLVNSIFSFARGACWFSEALLPTAFQARYRGEKRSESRTNADGVIGHFLIGEKAKTDLELMSGASQFVVIEAKINSPLSPGTRNVPGFDQAARNVACMAEVLRRADISPVEMDRLAFVVLAPSYSIEAGTFSDEMDPTGMKEKIKDRISSYNGELDAWYEEWAEPTLSSLYLHTLSWEQAILDLREALPGPADSLEEFYALCLNFN